MNQTIQPRVSPFITVVFRLLNYIEIIAVAGAGAAFVMMYSNMEGAAETIMVSLSALAGVFFLRGYAPQPVLQQQESQPKTGFLELLGGKIVPKAGWI